MASDPAGAADPVISPIVRIKFHLMGKSMDTERQREEENEYFGYAFPQ